jgi:hypothetical protein
MVNPIVTGVLGALVAVGITNLIPKAQADGSTSLFDGDKELINIPNQNIIQASVEVPITDFHVVFKRISAPTTKGSAQINIINQVKDNRLLHISIIPNTAFKASGQLELLINGKTSLNTEIGDLSDTDAMSLPIPNEGVFLEVGQGIKFTAWDASAGSITVMILTGVK